MKYDSVSDLNELLIANKSTGAKCDACCFNNYHQACYKMQCQDTRGHGVYWTLAHGTPRDVPFVWPDYARECMDIKSLCLKKKSDAYRTK